MLDPGTNVFLSGHGPFYRYMLKLKEADYDISQVKFMRCKRTFHFGVVTQAWIACGRFVYLSASVADMAMCRCTCCQVKLQCCLGGPSWKHLDLCWTAGAA